MIPLIDGRGWNGAEWGGEESTLVKERNAVMISMSIVAGKTEAWKFNSNGGSTVVLMRQISDHDAEPSRAGHIPRTLKPVWFRRPLSRRPTEALLVA